MQQAGDAAETRAATAVVFEPKALEDIERIRQRYPTNHAALIPVLFVAQRQFRVLTTEVMELVAATLELPATKVVSTATFYTMLNKRPVGRNHIQVCTNISCYLRGSDRVVEAFEDALDLDVGASTEDGCFTLSEVECLAACGRAPVVQINEAYHEWFDPGTAQGLCDEMRLEDQARQGGDA